MCDTWFNRVHQTNNFGLEMDIIQPYCLEANQEKNREESIGNVMSMIDEGLVRTDNMNFTSSS